MPIAYDKPWKDYKAQLDLLICRGMSVTDQGRALDYLERIGYYRLSGYWFAFRERSGLCSRWHHSNRLPTKGKPERMALDVFRPGTTFQNAVDLYVFDKQLRLLVMDALERIEVALRVDVSHTLGKTDPFAYLKPQLFHDDFSSGLEARTGLTRHHQWLAKHAQLINRSQEDFIRHHKGRYGLPLPIWIACEIWDFGTLSALYGGMRSEDQDAISASYGVRNGRVFASWLRSLNYLRNVCAHHSRLWNRNIIDQPKLPPAAELPWVAAFEAHERSRARCFLLLQITRHLLCVVNPRSSWPARLRRRLQAFPDLRHLELDLQSMGVPPQGLDDWPKDEKPDRQ